MVFMIRLGFHDMGSAISVGMEFVAYRTIFVYTLREKLKTRGVILMAMTTWCPLANTT